jgi:carotenoid 1,2-hydratase
MISALPDAPTAPGAYRWYYVDASAGDWTAVAIFMVGAQFSHRYSVGAERGEPPDRHCAVNFALYQGGRRRAWVFSEFPRAQQDGKTLRIGDSSFSVEGGRVQVRIDARQAPFGDRLQAALNLDPLCHGDTEVALLPGEDHYWQAVAPRAVGSLRVPAFGLDALGHGYHDTNRGEGPLGRGLRGWVWSRAHGAEDTQIEYRAFGGEQLIRVTAGPAGVELQRHPVDTLALRRSGWGLSVPALEASTLESSPFYARLEQRRPGQHTLTEVADFSRFHSPWFRWMARFRSRAEAHR